MAAWEDLVAFVRVRYEVVRQTDEELWFNLPTTGDRTQLVAVRLVRGADDHPWAQITSPICRVDQADLSRLLELAGESVMGGAAAVDGVVVFRHSIPLDEIALDAFDRPFRLVVETADRIEHELTGEDVH